MTTLGLIVLYIGNTFSGKNHDYGMFKKEFKVKDIFSSFEIMVDSGYQGVERDYIAKHIYIPHKKPRKSKNNPNPELTKEQKDYNREIAKKRVSVEHAISGIKRYNCLSNKFSNYSA